MTERVDLSRRRFLVASAGAAGGLLIGFHLPGAGPRVEAAESEAVFINAWLTVSTDDTVSIRVAHSEMGQGVYTALPMLVAEELEVDWRQVRAEMAPADQVYANRMFGIQATGGSTSVRSSFDHLRQAGAMAREMLVSAAARRWGVSPGACVARQGRVRHPPSGREAGYGSLARAAAELEAPGELFLKEPGEWRILGKPTHRLDSRAKVDGSAVFGTDVELEGLLVATVMACPVFGGKLDSLDEKPALAVKGVRGVVPLDDAVVVVAEGYWAAAKGLEALKPVWNEGPNGAQSSESIRALLAAGLEKPGAVARAQGSVQAATAAAERRHEAVYEVPFLAHATMEPMNATARVSENGAEIWAPTQGQGPVQQAVGGLLGLPPERIQVHTTFLGGGFGRRFEVDFVRYAVLAAREMQAPVKLIWSREEDMRHDFYRPAALARFRAGLNAQGLPVAWEARLVSPSIMSRVFPDRVKDGIDSTSVEGASDMPYAIANQHVDYVMQHTAVPVGFWRSVGNSQNTFFVESFLDELAHEGGQDPVALRLRLLRENPRHTAVLKRVAEAARWDKPAPPGRFRGVALRESFGSVVGQVAEVSVHGGKSLRVHRVFCVIDCGRAVNPDTVVAQMESGIVFGLTAAVWGEVTLRRGRVVEGNFDTYPMLRLHQMPAMHIHIIESGAEIGGVGEPATPPIAPAVANAIFAATGQRIRALPFSRHGLTLA